MTSSIESNNYNRGLWRLYEEGFAQFYQQLLIQEAKEPRGDEWLKLCAANEVQLRALYFAALQSENEGVKDFFGDWHSVIGISDAGYYLGAKLIQGLHDKFSIQLIAKLSFNEIKKEVLDFLNA